MDPDSSLEDLLATDIRTQIPEAVVSKVTSVAPWSTVPGAFNIRDLAPNVRPGFIYRSGALSGISDEGKSVLASTLNVTTIYDLRRPNERQKSSSPVIDGVDTVWLPYACNPAPVDLKLFAGGDNGVSGYVRMYLDTLDNLVPTFKKVLEHIRDSPEKPFLFHCTAGKDRTGVLAALILRLAGSSHDAIIHDYTLTRIGVEPARAALVASLNVKLDGQGTSPEAAGMLELCSIRASAMEAFLRAVEGSFENGLVGYVKTALGFSEQDVQRICANLKE